MGADTQMFLAITLRTGLITLNILAIVAILGIVSYRVQIGRAHV